MYTCSELAYGALDFNGNGFISVDSMMDSHVIKNRLLSRFTLQQIKEYLDTSGLFPEGAPGMNFDTFKKSFFPQLYNGEQEIDDEEDIKAAKIRNQLDQKLEDQPQVIEERLEKMEAKIKQKFSNCFHSVRKAFLSIDLDHNGFITVEEFLKFFGNDKDINYADLKKIIIDKDSSHQGKLGFTDFSKWLGSSIHMSEGFYFRHDS